MYRSENETDVTRRNGETEIHILFYCRDLPVLALPTTRRVGIRGEGITSPTTNYCNPRFRALLYTVVRTAVDLGATRTREPAAVEKMKTTYVWTMF